jgi:hypothetical protein
MASAFRDPNLQLAVLDAAWEAGLLPPYEKAAASPDPDAVDEAVRSALLAIELPRSVLESIREIDWGGGKVIQHLVIEMWDGEDDVFNVKDLSGIAACRNLRALSLIAASIADLSPLLDLPALASVKVGAQYADNARNREVLKELQKRGVSAPTREDQAARARADHVVTEQKRDIAGGLEAYGRGEFARAVAMLTPHESLLGGSDLLKLKMARKKAGAA